MSSLFRKLAPLLVLGVLGLSACSSVAYLAQAAVGQAELLLHARPVEEALADPALPPRTRARLDLARAAREFALTPEAQGGLGLPDHGAFRTFVDVGRDYVVWNVFSAPEFSVDLSRRCFPIAGCVGYQGYFQEAAAKEEAARRRAAGEDVVVAGISAYSTLGYLKDPILSTMLRYPEPTIVRTVIHELAHPAAYAKDDTEFNESYATAVENEGMRRWLAKYGNAELAAQDRLAQERAAEFEHLLLDTQVQLRTLYASDLAPDAMRERKAELIAGLRSRYEAQRIAWGYNGYDGWFERGVNNASIGSVSAYATLVPTFERVLARAGSLTEFVRICAGCATLPDPAARRRCLDGAD